MTWLIALWVGIIRVLSMNCCNSLSLLAAMIAVKSSAKIKDLEIFNFFGFKKYIFNKILKKKNFKKK